MDTSLGLARPSISQGRWEDGEPPLFPSVYETLPLSLVQRLITFMHHLYVSKFRQRRWLMAPSRITMSDEISKHSKF